MTKRDYYEVLQVTREADGKTIKRAYHKLAMEYHPDRNSEPEAEEKFKEASEAYEVLSDPQKRQLYDTGGFERLKNHGYGGFEGVGIDEIFSSFGDIFGDLFGFGGRGGRRGNSAQRGRDVRLQMAIDFEDAVFGTTKEVTVDQMKGCETCDASGAAPGSEPVVCSTCKGRGQVVHGQGMFLVSTTCPQCHGNGRFVSDPCTDCSGEGRVAAQRELTIKIPAGFDDGMSLRYGGEGEPGTRGGPAGDLYVHVGVRPHKTLRREGEELIAEVEVPMVWAALGTEIEIDGIEGKETVKIAKGTQPDTIITLKKRGVPRLRGNGRGDLHVICKVKVPTSLNSKEKKLLEEFAGKTKGKSNKKRGLFS